MTHPVRTLAALLIAVLGAGVGFLLFAPHGTRYSPPSAEAADLVELTNASAADYQPDLASLRSLANEGGVLHFAQQFYKRHGNIPQTPSEEDPFVFPETYTQEVWYLLTDAGQVLEGVSVVRASDGTILQRGFEHGDTYTIEDGSFNVVRVFPRDADGRYIDVDGLIDGATQHYEAMVQAGTYEREEHLAVGERPFVLYRDTTVRLTAPLEQQLAETNVTVPYADDHPSRPLKREETTTTDSLPISSSTWIDVAPGNIVLLERVDWLAFEGLPASSWCTVTHFATCESDRSMLP